MVMEDSGPARGRSRERRWAVRGLLIALGTVVIAVLPTDSAAGIGLPLVIEVVAVAVFCVAAARSAPGVRAVWWCLWASLTLTVLADVVYSYQQYHLGEDPFPGWADPLYLAAYVPELVALFLIVRGRLPHPHADELLDSAIMSLPVLSCVAAFVVVPLAAGDGATLANVISIAYPILDAVVLTGLIRLSVGGGHSNRSLGLITASVSMTTIGDLVYDGLAAQGVVEDVPPWLQALYTLGVVLMVAAALSRDAARITISEHRGRLEMSGGRAVALSIGTISLPVLLAFGLRGGDSGLRLLAVGAVVVNVLVLWRSLRLLAVLREQQHQLLLLARTDSLTGLPNRRTWDYELVRATTQADATGTDLVVAMLDIDHFKGFNDTFGHQAGDVLLAECAQAWTTSLGGDGWLARYGGEEFALLLPGVVPADSLDRLEAMRAATPDPVTTSIGVAVHVRGEAGTLAVADADAALYEAKNSGRNRVVIHGSEISADVIAIDRS